MLTIKVYLANDGSTFTLDKDFPVFQGQFNNILLNLYVPTTLLAPNFTEYADPTQQIISPFVAGTSVSVGARTIARNGSYKESEKFYMRYIKTLLKDNVSYALFERKLPKEFTEYAGQGNNAPKLIFNINNVKFGEITSATAVSSNTSLTLSSVDITTLKANIPAVSYAYILTYGEENLWYLNDEPILLSKFGISITSGTPVADDTITITVNATGSQLTNIATSQTLTLDVMPSNAFNTELPLTPSELEDLQARLNAVQLDLDDKQNKTDNGLITSNKTIVGAINQIAQNICVGENYIGTYTYTASSVTDLPTDTQLTAFVKTIKGQEYVLKNGDVVIVVQQIATVTDKNYKYFYNGTNWSHYEIPSVQLALNGVAGIVQGTYNIGDTNNTLVNISGGKILNIYVKNNGIYKDITTAFMYADVGATKQYVKDYALPKQFNDVFVLTNDGYFSDFGEHGDLEESKTSTAIGETLLVSKSYTLGDLQFQLSKKNSYKVKYYVQATSNENVTFRLYASLTKGTTIITASAVLSPTYSLVANTPTEIIFDNVFGLLSNVVNLETDDKIVFTLSVVRTISASQTFTVYSNNLLTSTFYLFTGVQGLINSKVVQTKGTSTIDVMSQKAVTDEFNAIINNTAITSVAQTTGGFLITYLNGVQIFVPITISGDISLDVNSTNNGIILSALSKLYIALVTPSQTTGLLEDEQIAFLSSKDSNYIEIDDTDGHIEKYYYQTNASQDGYRVYCHLEDEAGSPSIKSFTITISTKSWVITETSINNYNSQLNKPIINQDLTAVGFTPTANTYYKHTGTTNVNFTNGVIYFYDGEEYKAVDGSGSGSIDLNIENGEGLYSIKNKEDETTDPSRANQTYGRANVSFGHKNKTYQRNSFAFGGANKVGLTFEEWREQNPDGTQEQYNATYTHTFVGGESSKGLGRSNFVYGSNLLADGTRSMTVCEGNTNHANDAFLAGRDNLLNSNATGSLLVGGYNTVDTLDSIVGGSNNIAPNYSGNIYNASLFMMGNSCAFHEGSRASGLVGEVLRVKARYSFFAGSSIDTVGDIDNYPRFGFGKALQVNSKQAVFGNLNISKADPIFIIANGDEQKGRSNAVEVFDDGRMKVYGTALENEDVLTKAYGDSHYKLYRHNVVLYCEGGDFYGYMKFYVYSSSADPITDPTLKENFYPPILAQTTQTSTPHVLMLYNYYNKDILYYELDGSSKRAYVDTVYDTVIEI